MARSAIRALEEFAPYKDITRELPTAFIVDIDGTVAAHPQRGHYEYEKVDTDEPHCDVIDLVTSIAEFSFSKIIFVTGRMDDPARQVKEKTEYWLNKYFPLWDLLYMRANGDYRKDAIVKHELYQRYIEKNFNVIGVFDDRNQVVEMWRSLGLRVYQVAPGNF